MNLKIIAGCSVFFALIGPLIGALIFMPFLLIGEAIQYGLSLDAIFLIWMATTIVAFVLGAIPAFFTGFIRGIFQKRAPGWGISLCTGFAGCTSSTLYSRFIFDRGESHEPIMFFLIIFGVPGLIAGIVCTRIYDNYFQNKR